MAQAMARKRSMEEMASRSKAFRRSIILWAMTFLCIYLAITVISVQLRVREQQAQLDAIIEQIEIAKQENDELARVLAGDQDEYIERIAREKLGYAAVGERVFEDIAGID